MRTKHKEAWVVATPMAVRLGIRIQSPPPQEGGTQVDDFTKGFINGTITKHLRRRNGGGQGDPDPLMILRFWYV